MEAADLNFAAHCTDAVGWAGETREVFESFFAREPEGCRIAEIEGRPIGMCVSVAYRHSGFLGELIVMEEWRGRGIGRELLEDGIRYLRDKGIESIYLDGVPRAVPLYERAGFERICRSLRFHGRPTGRADPRVRRMRARDLPAVCALDREHFGEDRSFFLRQRLERHPDCCWILEEDRRIAEFVIGRRCPGAVAAGPWVIRADREPTGAVLLPMNEETLWIGVLETNASAARVLRDRGFSLRDDPPWRMVLGGNRGLGESLGCCAIGSAAKG